MKDAAVVQWRVHTRGMQQGRKQQYLVARRGRVWQAAIWLAADCGSDGIRGDKFKERVGLRVEVVLVRRVRRMSRGGVKGDGELGDECAEFHGKMVVAAGREGREGAQKIEEDVRGEARGAVQELVGRGGEGAEKGNGGAAESRDEGRGTDLRKEAGETLCGGERERKRGGARVESVTGGLHGGMERRACVRVRGEWRGMGRGTTGTVEQVVVGIERERLRGRRTKRNVRSRRRRNENWWAGELQSDVPLRKSQAKRFRGRLFIYAGKTVRDGTQLHSFLAAFACAISSARQRSRYARRTGSMTALHSGGTSKIGARVR